MQVIWIICTNSRKPVIKFSKFIRFYTASNKVIIPKFLVWIFYGKPQFPQSFGQFIRNSAEIVPFHKVSRLEIWSNNDVLGSVNIKLITGLFKESGNTFSKLCLYSGEFMNEFVSFLWILCKIMWNNLIILSTFSISCISNLNRINPQTSQTFLQLPTYTLLFANSSYSDKMNTYILEANFDYNKLTKSFYETFFLNNGFHFFFQFYFWQI